jgi:FMN-dependent NADH-azoreductase
MPTLLQIDSSPRSASVSSSLAGAFVAQWLRKHPGGTIIHHNTSLEKFPYLQEATVEAFFTAPAALTAAQKQVLACSDGLVDELLAADVIVLAAPMWNLSIPASLKAWIDLIVREGRTFAFTSHGVAPLVPAGKRVYVFTARGGAYPAGSPFHVLDHQEPYLRAILGVIGLTQVEFVHADRQSDSPEAAAEALAHAQIALESFAA